MSQDIVNRLRLFQDEDVKLSARLMHKLEWDLSAAVALLGATMEMRDLLEDASRDTEVK